MHVASKLISPCPSGVHSDTPDFGKPFPVLLAEVEACEVLPTAASLCPGMRFSGFALPAVIVHPLCSGGWGAVPARLTRLPLGPRGTGDCRERTPGYGVGWPLASSKARGSPTASSRFLHVSGSHATIVPDRIFCRPEESG